RPRLSRPDRQPFGVDDGAQAIAVHDELSAEPPARRERVDGRPPSLRRQGQKAVAGPRRGGAGEPVVFRVGVLTEVERLAERTSGGYTCAWRWTGSGAPVRIGC